MKVFTTAEVRQILYPYKREEISFSKMIELLNKKAEMNRLAEDIMEKEKSMFPNKNIVSDWPQENGDPEISKQVEAEAMNTPEHYNNEKGSLYLFSENQELNAWEFDAVKRICRCRKKGQFLEDIDKTIAVLELYKKEYKI